MKAILTIQKKLTIVFFILLASSGVYAQNIGGIGAMLAIDSTDDVRMPVIKQLLPNSPAAAALKEKQFIIKVNDVSCNNKTIEETVAMIRGEAGSHVRLLVADNKKGKGATEHDMVRASIQQPPAPPVVDPVAAFNTESEAVVKQLKKLGHTIVKTFNSDCGNFFFNFNAEPGTYEVAIMVLEEKPGAAAGNSMTARVFDNNNEAAAVTLKKGLPQNSGSFTVGRLEGDITFGRACVGSVNTRATDAGGCKSMFIVVYK